MRITLDVKKEIIAKHENGIRVSDLAFAVRYGEIVDLYHTEEQRGDKGT